MESMELQIYFFKQGLPKYSQIETEKAIYHAYTQEEQALLLTPNNALIWAEGNVISIENEYYKHKKIPDITDKPKTTWNVKCLNIKPMEMLQKHDFILLQQHQFLLDFIQIYPDYYLEKYDRITSYLAHKEINRYFQNTANKQNIKNIKFLIDNQAVFPLVLENIKNELTLAEQAYLLDCLINSHEVKSHTLILNEQGLDKNLLPKLQELDNKQHLFNNINKASIIENSKLALINNFNHFI